MVDSAATAGAAFAVAGLILLCTGLSRLVRRRAAEIHWKRCEAVMHSQAERRLWKNMTMLDPVMSYTFEGKSYVARIRTGDAGSIHQLGGRYNLLCDPENPEKAIFETDRTDFILMRAFIISGCALIVLGEILSFLL